MIGNSFIIFADPDSKVIYSNWVLIINSLIAVGLSAIILVKDKDREEGEGNKRKYSSSSWSDILVYCKYNMGVLWISA